MRSLIIATILCLWSAPAFACMYDSDCKTGNICISGACTPSHSTDDNDAPAPAKRVTKGKEFHLHQGLKPRGRLSRPLNSESKPRRAAVMGDGAGEDFSRLGFG